MTQLTGHYAKDCPSPDKSVRPKKKTGKKTPPEVNAICKRYPKEWSTQRGLEHPWAESSEEDIDFLDPWW